MRTPKYKSAIVDIVIITLEEKMRRLGKHLIKTETIFQMCCSRIDLSDDSEVREELLEIGMRQVIQSRLYCRGYFSVAKGYFVNVEECTNLAYLDMIVHNKDDVINGKAAARNRNDVLRGGNGQMTMVSDDDGNISLMETKTEEEIINDLEADAV